MGSHEHLIGMKIEGLNQEINILKVTQDSISIFLTLIPTLLPLW